MATPDGKSRKKKKCCVTIVSDDYFVTIYDCDNAFEDIRKILT